MIYFLDNSLQLQKIVTSKNVISAIHEHELNGLIRADVELDLSYANKFLVLGIDHVGYYYKDEFYLHKIQRVEYDHVNETAMVVLRHIFFEDMIFGKLIRDVRPQNQDALTVSRQTIDANTRWQTIMTDVTGRLSTNFYWQVPYEVIEFMTENYRIEYLPKILFDGQKINGFQLHLANKIGEDKNIRIPYGSRVLDLKYEEDYSEIITKLVVHGKGEEVGDGYGRRINISDVNFSRNGVESPVGSLYLEDETITNTYGNDGQTPREGREVFEDIEDANELAEAGYQHYLQVSRPQMLFTADVADIGDVGIGDSVMIIRREYDVYFNARIHKLSVDLLYPEDAQVELGDYKHFKESKVARKTREKNNRVQGQLSDRITRLKLEADERFDNELNQWREEYEQALIDVHAEIEADRENMTDLINTKTEEFDASFAAGMAEAERKRQENYDAMSEHVNTTVDTTRTELGNAINASIDDAKLYAEQQAQAKAEAVRTDLETVTSGHQGMLESLQDNVMSIDDFLGPKDRTLQYLLDSQRLELERKIEVYNRRYPNMIVGSTLENINGFEAWGNTHFELKTDESLNYIRVFDTDINNSNNRAYTYPEDFLLENGKTYTLALDFRSESVKDLDYIYFNSTSGNILFRTLNPNVRGLSADGNWHRYYFTFTWTHSTRRSRLMIGTDYVTGDVARGWFDTRQVHLYEGVAVNIPWTPSPSDNSQVVTQLLYEVRQLDDGMKTLATKTEFDILSGEFTQFTNEYIETSEGVSRTLQEHDDWFIANGARMELTADGFDSKAWLADIHNPNLLTYTDFTKSDNINQWWGWGTSNVGTYQDYMIVRNTNSSSNIAMRSSQLMDYVIPGETYTISWQAGMLHSQNHLLYDNFDYLFVWGTPNGNISLPSPTRRLISSDSIQNLYEYKLTFKMPIIYPTSRILIGIYTKQTGADVTYRFRYPKLELGSVATPYHNAFSGLTQRADEIMLAVQGIDVSGFLSQSDIQIVPDYVQLGSQRIDGSNIGSLLRVSPSGIDMVAEAMRLSGDLYVDGDITALAVDAIEGNFARLFANQLTANVINGSHIESNTIEIKHLTGYDAILEMLMARRVFSDEVTAKVGNYIDLNAGNIVTAGLSANVITADHIQVGTQLVDKMFATSARIDQLITKTHFVNEINALTMNVIDLNASQIRTRLLSANTIEASWIKSGTALLDRVFSSTGMFERMMAKSGFVTSLSAVTLDLHELTIWRPDGVAFVMNGMERFGHPVPVVRYLDDQVETDDKTYWTNSRGAQIVGIAYGDHAGRYYNLAVGMGLRWDSDYAVQYCNVQIRTVNSPSGVNIPVFNKEITARRADGLQWHTLSVPLGRPTYGAMTFQIEIFRRGDNVYAPVEMRYGRSWISA